MIRLLVILTYIFLISPIIGQNLVANGDFELYSTCPYNQGQIRFAIMWDSASSTPDYFNSCSSYLTGFSVPKNTFGYQKDYANKNGYAGLFVFTKTTDPNGVREYIHATLTDTLQQNHKYIASMYVSLSNKCEYAISSMGMNFSDTIIYSANPNLGTYINIPNPQIKSNIILSDTLNWMLVTDTFIANGGERFLTIGNFSPTSQSDTTFLYANSFPSVSYYYIDNVSVLDMESLEINEIKTDTKTALVQNAPNPFGDGTMIKYFIPEGMDNAQIIFFDEFGNQLKIFTVNESGAGQLNVTTGSLAPGTYSYSLIINGKIIDSKKMVKQ